ncbi:D-TA family PLP-dependent enzyme [Arenibacter sp. GZD96]|uniref:D-TA family PLP-dependent enzyme n=1 Tax=Aurantibrevibacter litoralis TaxID=3106030 RepID=UPI002AFF011F|nr:D-TA family PLP-dependent enzyme [Arenibacter sp. GZD-96]MEA1785526.1 D-TA family PLP-dependent enzyme [Arenibacter sp. GZD-96]
METLHWYTLNAPEHVISPSLLLYPDRIEQNIQTMISMAGGTAFLQPHVKTHKMAEIIQMQMAHGIFKFKCATIAEAQLLATCQAKEILLAMQPVGIHIDRLFTLIEKYPNATFSTLVDNTETMQQLASKAKAKNSRIGLWLDLNLGMNRTGIVPDAEAEALCVSLAQNPNINLLGLHAYDGHIRESDPDKRKTVCDDAFQKLLKLTKNIEEKGVQIPAIIAGGSPTFPIHAKRNGVTCSPGTTLMWDAGYGKNFSDLGMLPAAVLFTRVVSKPAPGLLCLDLGHKSVASEMPLPRVVVLGLENAKHLSQSEEHLVLETQEAHTYSIGHVFYAIPNHICPTVTKYKNAAVVHRGEITERWQVAARDHQTEI